MTYKSLYGKSKNKCKDLKAIINNELSVNENIFITTISKLDDMNNKEWYKFEEYTNNQIFNIYDKKEKVAKYWHEDGLCVILNR